jgi:predicted nucleic acid-binding protein
MKIAVKDANVFIDLELAGLLDLWFQLGIETHTSIFIREELELGAHSEALSHFDSGNVTTHDFEFSEIETINALMEEVNRAAKFNDCSVLYLAEKLGAPLLSGDSALRKSATRRGLEVKGTLWVFDELISAGLLTSATAVAKLTHLLTEGSYFPAEACDERLARWSNE